MIWIKVKTAMEEANDNPRHPSDKSGVYEQYGSQPHINEYNEYHNPFDDKPKNEISVWIISFIINVKCF